MGLNLLTQQQTTLDMQDNIHYTFPHNSQYFKTTKKQKTLFGKGAEMVTGRGGVLSQVQTGKWKH